MRTTINLIILFIVCTAANIGISLYYFDNQKANTKSAEIKTPSTVGYEAVAIAAALENAHKQSLYRDTVIVKQVLRTQHHLKMHGKKVPMCPDCINSKPGIKYKYTIAE